MGHLAATYFQNNTAGLVFFKTLLSTFRLITKREDSLYNKAVYLKLKTGLIFFPLLRYSNIIQLLSSSKILSN